MRRGEDRRREKREERRNTMGLAFLSVGSGPYLISTHEPVTATIGKDLQCVSGGNAANSSLSLVLLFSHTHTQIFI